MPNIPLAANAAAMPSRRAALAGLAATGALLIAPAARAEAGDADIYAQVARVHAAHDALLAAAAADFPDDEAAEAAFEAALDALSAAQESLIEMQPRSLAALQAMAAALLESDAFGPEEIAPALARLIVATAAAGAA